MDAILTEQLHPYSIHINAIGIVAWVLLYFYLGIHLFPKELNYIHIVFGAFVAILMFNGWHCDDKDSTLDTEMKMKDDIESVSARLCLLVATALFSTSAIEKYKGVPKQVKHNFMKILSVAIVILLGISMNISTPKKAEKIRKMRKLEAVFMNISIALIIIAFMSVFHYL